MPVKVFGTVHMNAFANSGEANWLDNPNLVSPDPADGHTGTFSATLRQTRVGLTMDGPTLGTVRTSAVASLDFFGGIPGFQTGQVMGLPRLLVAFARFDGERAALEAGQDHMLLAPRDPTSLAAFAFPALFRSGNLYLRTPQVRVEYALTQHLRAAGGIVAPIAGDLVGEDYRFVPPALSGERSRRPGLQARVAFSSDEPDARRLVDVGVSGHYGWERRPGELDASWASALEIGLRRDWVGFSGEAFVGDNIDAFGGALGLDRRASGGWGELRLFPSDRLSINLGAGLDDIRRADRRARATQPQPLRIRQRHLLAHTRDSNVDGVPVAGDDAGWRHQSGRIIISIGCSRIISSGGLTEAHDDDHAHQSGGRRAPDVGGIGGAGGPRVRRDPHNHPSR